MAVQNKSSYFKETENKILTLAFFYCLFFFVFIFLSLFFFIWLRMVWMRAAFGHAAADAPLTTVTRDGEMAVRPPSVKTRRLAS